MLGSVTLLFMFPMQHCWEESQTGPPMSGVSLARTGGQKGTSQSPRDVKICPSAPRIQGKGGGCLPTSGPLSRQHLRIPEANALGRILDGLSGSSKCISQLGHGLFVYLPQGA